MAALLQLVSPMPASVLAEIDRHLDNLKRCLLWLTDQGVSVMDVDLKRGRAQPTVIVGASPRLHRLFRGDCANVGCRPEGHGTRRKWVAVRFDVAIHWEEVEA